MARTNVQRVLIAHNRYQHRGGEDVVVEEEAALLRNHGVEVEIYQRDNADLNALSRGAAALQTFWSRRTVHEVGALISKFRPQVMHVHNTLPLISPSIYWAAARARIPVVQTVHNFRLVCPQALMLREGRPCEDCVGRLPWPGVVHGCYRGSRSQTAVLAGMLGVHRLLGTWDRKIARYILLTEFVRPYLVRAGIPADKMRVKPNSTADVAPSAASRSGFVFVGRLSPEKGVDTLAAAVATGLVETPVTIVGDGPARARLQGQAGITCTGALPGDGVRQHVQRALALVVPSIWYEMFPLVVVESFACATPVIASRIGALATLVEEGRTGLLFEPGDAHDLATKLAWAQAHPAEMLAMGRNARRFYENELTHAANARHLLGIYEEVLLEAQGRTV